MGRLTDMLFSMEQGIALRGHHGDIMSGDFETANKNPGNFLALVKLLSKYDNIL